ncbi:MAG TPA: hypothetical protein VIZ68_06190 [Thermoplasmata archaeon]
MSAGTASSDARANNTGWLVGLGIVLIILAVGALVWVRFHT